MRHGEPAFLPSNGAYFAHQSGNWNLNLREESIPTESRHDRRHMVRAILYGPDAFTGQALFEATTTDDIIFQWADHQIEYLPRLWASTRESNKRDQERIHAMLRRMAQEGIPA